MNKITIGKRFMNALLSKKGELDLTGGQDNTTPQENQTPQIDYSKLAELVNEQMKETQAKANRESQRKENEILKSYFAQEGLNEDEMKQAINDYKKAKKQEQSNKDDEISKLSTRIKELEDGIKAKEVALSKKELDISLKDIFKQLELKDKARNVFKLDESKAIKEDGTIDNEYVKAQVETFKNEYPEFVIAKETKQKTPGIQVSTGIANSSNGDASKVDYTKLSFEERMKLYRDSKK